LGNRGFSLSGGGGTLGRGSTLLGGGGGSTLGWDGTLDWSLGVFSTGLGWGSFSFGGFGFFLLACSVGDSLLSQVLEEFDIFAGSLLGSLPSFFLFSSVQLLSSESDVGDQSLDLGGLIVDLAVLFNLSGVKENESSWIVGLLEIEQFTNSGGSLGTSSSWFLIIGQTFDFSFTLLDNCKSQNGEIVSDDAASDGLSLSFTGSSWSEAAVSLFHEDSGSASDEDTLFHGESVLIVSSGNFEQVALEFVTKFISSDFLTHSFTEESSQFFIVVNDDGLLEASDRVRNV